MTTPADNPPSATIAQLRAEIEALRAALARTHRLSLLGTLAGSIAHEFNNLLTPVMSYAEMALESPEDAALTTKALERAQHGCDRASRIASAILAFACDRGPVGIAGGAGGSGEEQRADVARAVREALLCLAQDPGRTGVELELRIDPNLEPGIGQTSLQQVILNLVLNALKAMRGQPGRLAISARNGGLHLAGSTWNNPVVIEVSDTGCGIDPARLPHVFDAFVSSSGAAGGAGLGLTICKQLVEAAGGRIEVSSQVGMGTVFTITLASAAPTSEGLRVTA